MRTLLLLLATCLTCGCGGGVELPELGMVSGTVTNGGSPVAEAVVTFSPTGEGRPSTATTDAEGKYTLLYNVDNEGAIIGKHIVSVVAVTSEEDYQEADEVTGEQPDGGLPAKASDGSMIVEVKAGENLIDIPLE